MSNPTDKPIEKFQGFIIYKNPEDGFWWAEGGYFDTAQECRDDIASWNGQQLAHECETYGEPHDARDVALDPQGCWGAP